MSKIGGAFRFCCGSFYPKEVLILSGNTEFAERIMRTGICPECNSFVIQIDKRRFDGSWTSETAKRKKALKLYNEYKSDIVGDYNRSIKHGNRSNMGFRFGLNTETIQNGKSVIKQFAVDFNGTKELINTMM